LLLVRMLSRTIRALLCCCLDGYQPLA
jgi:hypothetical protein